MGDGPDPRSIALDKGFSSPLICRPGQAPGPPVYPTSWRGFQAVGIYSQLSAWVIFTFNSIFSGLTCLTLYRIAQKITEYSGASHAWTWAFVSLRGLLAGTLGVGTESECVSC